jgi:hypothetical protein
VNNDVFNNNLQIFPNPVNNILHIENATGNIEQINFYDISGKQLPITYDIDSATANVSMLNKGFYLCQIQFANGETIIKKLIKE